MSGAWLLPSLRMTFRPNRPCLPPSAALTAPTAPTSFPTFRPFALSPFRPFAISPFRPFAHLHPSLHHRPPPGHPRGSRTARRAYPRPPLKVLVPHSASRSPSVSTIGVGILRTPGGCAATPPGCSSVPGSPADCTRCWGDLLAELGAMLPRSGGRQRVRAPSTRRVSDVVVATGSRPARPSRVAIVTGNTACWCRRWPAGRPRSRRRWSSA